jgi:hypothetical protein
VLPRYGLYSTYTIIFDGFWAIGAVLRFLDKSLQDLQDFFLCGGDRKTGPTTDDRITDLGFLSAAIWSMCLDGWIWRAESRWWRGDVFVREFKN